VRGLKTIEADINELSLGNDLYLVLSNYPWGISKGCSCGHHQDIYDNWPTLNPQRNIASYIKMSTYYGKDFSPAPKWRKHMIRTNYGPRKLKIDVGQQGGRHSVTPIWASKDPSPQPSSQFQNL
jgi:hypothetical protein